ncbi:unnamed protein product [Cuscuta campestris]|uniref:Uncharacterized protein n=1 Tax=Cuscuta campestris TaxID=132261 RepID=A0A484LNR4_9ASTE|nr:unnamed protein product [Cuscuta campestris]
MEPNPIQTKKRADHCSFPSPFFSPALDLLHGNWTATALYVDGSNQARRRFQILRTATRCATVLCEIGRRRGAFLCPATIEAKTGTAIYLLLLRFPALW